MDAFGSIPIYRAHESGARAGDASRNDESFARCRAELAAGGALALFPEGVSHSDPQLRPLKTGAARIALSAEAEHDGKLGVTVVPVGLYYERKALFRSSVLLVVGEPIAVAPLLGDYRRDERAAVDGADRGRSTRGWTRSCCRRSRASCWPGSRASPAGRASGRGCRRRSRRRSISARASWPTPTRGCARAIRRASRRSPPRSRALHARAAAAGRARSVGAGAGAAAPGRAGGGVRQADRRGAAGGDRRGDGLAPVPAGGRGREARHARRGCAGHGEAARGRGVPGASRGGWRRSAAGFAWGAALGGADVRCRRRDRLRRAALRGAAARGAPRRGGAWWCCAPSTTRPTQRLAERRRALADAVASGLRDADAADADASVDAQFVDEMPRTQREPGYSTRRSSMIIAGHGRRRRAAAAAALRGDPGEDDLAVRVGREADRPPSSAGRA